MIEIEVNTPKHTYPVYIRPGLMNSKELFDSCSKSVVIITDENIEELYGIELKESLHAELLTVPPGENSKTREVKASLEDQMQSLRFGRDCTVIALGGGVICDLAGYIAGTYCRGVDLIMIPTSLLAMVDASIGGKNGVDTPYGKNLIGTIYHPKSIFMDLDLLSSLPVRELRGGMIEVIKHGIIYDEGLFAEIEKNLEGLLQEPSGLGLLVEKSCLIKKEIISGDEKEKGRRRLLNFGHTVGHAIEKLSEYRIRHGEAVALGIKSAAKLSKQLLGLSEDDLGRIYHLIDRCCPDLKIPEEISIDQLIKVMKRDKKAKNGIPRFVLVEEIGKAASFKGEFCTPISDDILDRVLPD